MSRVPYVPKPEEFDGSAFRMLGLVKHLTSKQQAVKEAEAKLRRAGIQPRFTYSPTKSPREEVWDWG